MLENEGPSSCSGKWRPGLGSRQVISVGLEILFLSFASRLIFFVSVQVPVAQPHSRELSRDSLDWDDYRQIFFLGLLERGMLIEEVHSQKNRLEFGRQLQENTTNMEKSFSLNQESERKEFVI